MSKKWIDKKKGQTFSLVHRSHEDPLFYDEEAGDSVFVPVKTDNKQKPGKVRLATATDLKQEFDGRVRENEGQAALYGIPFDDSEYDYMQHLKPIGEGPGVFISKDGEAQEVDKGEIRIKMPEELLPVPSEQKIKVDYQNQQEIPDAIGGFQPDMDPDLREVLMALEDEAYLDETQDVEEGDIFDKLLAGGAKDDDGDEDYDEYDLDNYEDDYEDYDSDKNDGKEDWERDFAKFKRAQSRGKIKNDWDTDDEFDSDDDSEEERDEVPDLPDLPNINNSNSSKAQKKKQRRKKGAMTDTSSFSMTSSALERTEGLRLLDDRYEVVKKQYDEEDEEDDYEPFDFKNERSDFEGMIDDFLDNYTLEAGGRKLAKRNEESERLAKAANSVSNTKLALKKKKDEMKGLSKGLKSLKF